MKKVLFLANHFITLYSFRKELIEELLERGCEVYISLPDASENKYFESIGCKVIPTKIVRRSVNPLDDIKLIFFYKKMLLSIKPDIIFSYTIKPNIYGSFASNSLKMTQICNITGTGGLFLKKNFLTMVCKFLYRHSVRKCKKVFFQNKDDFKFFVKNKLVSANGEVIPGSGCNTEKYSFSPMPRDENIKFIFAGRIMKIKGIEEYLRCAEIVKKKYANTTFYIDGWFEEKKYKNMVRSYQRRGIVKYGGFQSDIRNHLERCHCAVLPSHGGEGVPNVLLEAAATGRLCIASDVSGARDVVSDGKNGFLFENGSVDSLVCAVEKVIALTHEQKSAMGRYGRARIENKFNRKHIVNKYFSEVLAI